MGRDYFCGADRLANLADLGLVIIAIVELMIEFMHPRGGEGADLTVLRVVRLSRISRLMRMARFETFSELTMMVQGAIGGVRTLFWAVVLILTPVYAVALIM